MTTIKTLTHTVTLLTAILLPALLAGCGEAASTSSLPEGFDPDAVDLQGELSSGQRSWLRPAEHHHPEVCENDLPGHDHGEHEGGRRLDGPRTVGHPSAQARLARLDSVSVAPRVPEPDESILHLQRDYLDAGCADAGRDPACDDHPYKPGTPGALID